MNKYEVEDNIDFYEQLKKSMDNDDDEDSRETHCLITNLPLIEPYITMKCGHSFNYAPLVKDITSVKSNNHMERFRLKANQIRCPYCRSIENHVLPYIRHSKCSKKESINWLDVSKHKIRDFLSYSDGPCSVCDLSKKTILSPCGQLHYCLEHYKEFYPRNKVFSSKKVYNFKVNSNNHENIIIHSATTEGCCSILKSGPRKGQMCGAVKKLDNYCLRHAPKQ